MNYPEYNLVQRCKLKIENQLSWGDSKLWHNDMFIELSEKIQQNTHVLLSPTTLKRVWGRVDYKSSPSISTLNALAKFAGYSNWRAFKNEEFIKRPNWFENNITPNLAIIMISASIMTVVFISFFSLKGLKNERIPIDYSKITFKSTSVTKGLPNTVVFDFNLNGIYSDSLIIQQFWDPTKTIDIKKDQTQATGQYYYPGYFRAKLLVDGEIIKEHDLFIESNGWLGTIDYKPIPKYINEKELLTNKLAFQQKIIDEVAVSPTPLYTTFQFIKKFENISGDNFELNTKIKNTYNDKWAVCQIVKVIIVGTKSALVVPFSIPGCVSEIGVMLSDNFISGKENDLSSLGIDMSHFRNVQLKVVDKNITVFVDNTALFSSNYNNSIGEIAGVRFQFLGIGDVENAFLSNGVETLNLLDY